MLMCPVDSAEKIAQTILEKRIAACVNITSELKSVYWWKGRKETTIEKLLIIKTKSSLFVSLEKLVRSVHPYEVPEIIALPIIRGHKPYLNWIDAETRKKAGRKTMQS